MLPGNIPRQRSTPMNPPAFSTGCLIAPKLGLWLQAPHISHRINIIDLNEVVTLASAVFQTYEPSDKLFLCTTVSASRNTNFLSDGICKNMRVRNPERLPNDLPDAKLDSVPLPLLC